MKANALKRLIIFIVAELVAVAGAVWFFDPFYQYHEPFFGWEAVLNDRDNQMPGTIRNFQYDSVLAGSSVAENFDSAFLDEAYDCRTLKVIRASGSMADLLYYLEMAQEEKELENVFWCLDLFALNASTEVTLYGENTPRYLHTESFLDDIPYLYNKEVLLEKIPFMLAYGHEGMNTGGNAYNWARGKEFSAARALSAYERQGITKDTVIMQKDPAENRELILENIRLLEEQISAHPKTCYYVLFPPYSMLWWDCAYVNGELEERFYILEETVSMLLRHENVETYFFQNQAFVVCDLDNYMDMVHYSPEINRYMLERMAAGEDRVTEENWGRIMNQMRDMVEWIVREGIYSYYGQMAMKGHMGSLNRILAGS
ncbi:SGNH/GDSL hydrolase family protein [bacterium D16-50]|nr:SGNH/GDSL hydrolase family protein [bacterium D16-50]